VDRAELREAGESILRRETGSDLVRRLCPRCGSSQHGRPSVRGGAHVSLSYADGLVAVAWSTSGPVGIDVELGDRVEWTRLEALLKAAGEGVTQQPTDRPDLPDLPTRELRLPEGYVGTVAGNDVSWRLAGPAAPPSAATS
jgi:hypothetical protein